MKNRIAIFGTLCTLLLGSSCSSSGEYVEPMTFARICGEWAVTEASEKSEFAVGDYLLFEGEGDFVWYLDVAPYGYDHQPGEVTYTIVDQTIELSGRNDDRSRWKHNYVASEITEDAMTWLSKSGSETLVFSRQTIPAAAKIPPVSLSAICGDWMLTEWSGSADFAQQQQIYLRIGENGSFELWQHLVSSGYQRLNGTFKHQSQGQALFLDGVYSDGEEWGASYVVTDIGENTMVWTATEGTDRCVYTRTPVPDDLLSRPTRAEAEGSRRFL